MSVLLPGCSGNQLTTDQKLEDFRYMFDILRENHPYLALKARVEGYDWLAHEQEFEEAVRRTRTDREFAREIGRILLLINNGHTTVLNPHVYDRIVSLPGQMKPWLDEAAKTDAQTVKKWFDLFASGFRLNKVLPFQAFYIQGEYYVINVFEEGKGISPGQKVVRIDGRPVHEFVAALRGTTPLSYDPGHRRLYMHQLLVTDVSKRYDVVLENPDKTYVQARVDLVRREKDLVDPVFPTNLLRKESNVYTGYLADGRVAYMHVSQMTPYEASQGDKAVLNRFYAEIKDVPSLIIDIRGNRGGDDTFWMLNIVRPLATGPVRCSGGSVARSGNYIARFLRANKEFGQTVEGLRGEGAVVDKSDLSRYLTPTQIANLPPETLTESFGTIAKQTMVIEPSGEFPYKGRIFLLVDRKVFSAAEGFASFCKSSGWATVVGERTGGDGGGSTPVIMVLPNSRMAIFFPSTMGLNADFTANEETHTTPDVLAEPDPQDLVRYAEALAKGVPLGDGPNLEYDAALRECLRLALGGE
ncbi:MAG: PDZ domain-containing protein [Firmicutes bacterium]|nr:PDZ domain-containing protein [Bacillota bacterium]